MALRNVNTSVYYLNRRANLIKSAKLKDITAPVPQYHRLLELKKAKNVGELNKTLYLILSKYALRNVLKDFIGCRSLPGRGPGGFNKG